jgi:chitin disaccharide deacetylase
MAHVRRGRCTHDREGSKGPCRSHTQGVRARIPPVSTVPTRRLIVNADDFGLTEGVTHGIVDAHVAGIVTSTSLMVDWPAAEYAAELMRGHPALSVGLHFVDDGPDLDQPGHAEREFARQLERFRALTRSEPTHVDSHHHVHVTRISTFAPLVAPLGVPLRADGRVRYLGAFYAHPRPGEVDQDRIRPEFLLALLESEATAEFSELGCHPGRVTEELSSSYGPERAIEIATLTEAGLRARIRALGLTLSSYHDWRARR